MNKQPLNRLTLKNVEILFPNLKREGHFNGAPNGYGARFVIPKTETSIIKNITDIINRLYTESQIKKLSPDKVAIRDGELVSPEYNSDSYILNTKSTTPIKAYDEAGVEIDNENGILTGDHVDAIVSFWFQNNHYGKRINANLHGVRLVKARERSGVISVADIEKELSIIPQKSINTDVDNVDNNSEDADFIPF